MRVPGIPHDAGDALDELAEALESGGSGAARVGAGIRGVHEIDGLEGMAVRTHPLEDGRAGEDVPRRDAKLRETGLASHEW